MHNYLQRSFDGEIVPTTFDEVQSLIAETKTRKAPGIDGVKNVLLKHLPSVTPVLKPKKDPTNPLNYRPISLLSLISKIFERIIGKRLRTELINKRVIPVEQFGFMENCSTAHAHAIIKDEVNKALNDKKNNSHGST